MKQFVKKAASQLLAGMLMLGALGTFTLTAEAKQTFIYQDDFSSETVGQAPSNWEVYQNNYGSETAPTITVQEENGNKFFRMQATANATYQYPIVNTKANVVNASLTGTDQVVLSMKVRFNNSNSSTRDYIRLGYPAPENEVGYADPGGNNYSSFVFRANGFRYLNGTEINGFITHINNGIVDRLTVASGVTTSNNTWYDVQVVMNPVTDTAVYTIDGSSFTGSLSGTYTNTKGFFDNITIKIVEPKANDTVDLDDIQVYYIYGAPEASLLTDNGTLPANTESLQVQFSKSIDTDTLHDGTVQLFDGNGGLLTCSTRFYDESTNMYYLTPDAPLTEGESYTVKLSDEIYAGNAGAVGDAAYDAGKLTGETEFPFTITRAKSTNANLSAITINGRALTGFSSNVTDYLVDVQYAEDMTLPIVTATAEDSGAKDVEISNPADFTGAVTIKVTAEDGITTKTYTIRYQVVGEELAKLGENLITNPGFENGSTSGYAFGTGGNFVLETGEVHTGNYAAKSTGRTDPQQGYYEQNVTVQKGRTYLLAGWFKTVTGTEAYEIYPKSSQVDRINREEEMVVASPTEWKQVIMTIETKAVTTVTPTILSWSTTTDYYVDDLYVGELKPIFKYTGEDTLTFNGSAEASLKLTGEIVNQFGTKNGLASAEITDWRLIDAPYGVSLADNVLKASVEAEAGVAVIEATFDPNYLGDDIYTDSWTGQVEINLADGGAAVPYAKEVTLSGKVETGETLTAGYRYYHKADEAEGDTVVTWLYSDSADSGYQPIPGASLVITDPNALHYTVEAAYADCYIRVQIQPKTVDGDVGSTAMSADYLCKETAPVAKDVSVTASTKAYGIGDVLTGSYTFYDVNQDAQEASTFRWLRYNAGTKEYEPIAGATGSSYTLAQADVGTTLRFEVTPVAVNEPKTGVPALSDAINGPAVPYVQNVGIKSVGNGLYGAEYDYVHPNGVAEGDTVVRWYVNGSLVGEGISCQISGSSNIRLEVTPVAMKEPAVGEMVSATKSVGSSRGSSGSGSRGSSFIPMMTNNDEAKQSDETQTAVQHWATEAINWAVTKGYMSNMEDGTFQPDSLSNREEFLTSVFTVLGLTPAETYSGIFGDVAGGTEFSKLLQASVAYGIISEYDNFYPERSISREEISKIVVTGLQAAGIHTGAKGDIASFTDMADIAPWAEGYVAEMLGTGLMQGVGDGMFMPKGHVTRAQTATILMRLEAYIENMKAGVLSE